MRQFKILNIVLKFFIFKILCLDKEIKFFFFFKILCLDKSQLMFLDPKITTHKRHKPRKITKWKIFPTRLFLLLSPWGIGPGPQSPPSTSASFVGGVISYPNCWRFCRGQCRRRGNWSWWRWSLIFLCWRDRKGGSTISSRGGSSIASL